MVIFVRPIVAVPGLSSMHSSSILTVFQGLVAPSWCFGIQIPNVMVPPRAGMRSPRSSSVTFLYIFMHIASVFLKSTGVFSSDLCNEAYWE